MVSLGHALRDKSQGFAFWRARYMNYAITLVSLACHRKRRPAELDFCGAGGNGSSGSVGWRMELKWSLETITTSGAAISIGTGYF